MFTGLIEDIGTVRRLRRSPEGMELLVTTGLPTAEFALGESIAVDGVCLTVTSVGDGFFAADVSPESLERTGLGRLSAGSPVNLERALQFGARLGGHLVSGHVDCQAEIASRQPRGNAVVFSFRMPADSLRYVIEKGSVAIDGTSLTVNAVDDSGFSIAVIPHTLESTTLAGKSPGDAVNIETDMIGKYIERLLCRNSAEKERRQGRIDIEYLAKNGFL
ncbi:MAG: riboflavin synthase [Desulfuromonadales bacterium]|nr:riboflavin synthase [Desulfuromonadales bacterium]NIS40264.1 riboflavin synthase [Desulfuromonadales bacterium]